VSSNAKLVNVRGAPSCNHTGNAAAATAEAATGVLVPIPVAVNNGWVNPNQVRDAQAASEEKQVAKDNALLGDGAGVGTVGGVDGEGGTSRVVGTSNGDKVVSKNRPTSVSTESTATACDVDDAPTTRALVRDWCKRRSNRNTKSHAAVSHSAGTVEAKLAEVGAGPTLVTAAADAAAGDRDRARFGFEFEFVFEFEVVGAGLGTVRNDNSTCRHCKAKTNATKAECDASDSF
jgi:hypothetical protein